MIPDLGSIAINPAGTFLYAVGRTLGGIVECQIDQTTGTLKWTGTLLTDAFGSRGLLIDPSGKFFYTIDDFEHTAPSVSGVSSFSIDATSGNLTKLKNSPYPLSSINAPQQAVFDPTGKFIYSDLGITGPNQIAGFTRDLNSGDLQQLAGSPFVTRLGQGSTISGIAIHRVGFSTPWISTAYTLTRSTRAVAHCPRCRALHFPPSTQTAPDIFKGET
jgi:DNA-binding beta-propeller fold protein YncE